MVPAVGGDFVTRRRDFTHQAGQAIRDPPQHEERARGPVIRQQSQQAQHSQGDTALALRPRRAAHVALQRRRVEILLDVGGEDVHRRFHLASDHTSPLGYPRYRTSRCIRR